MRARSLRLSLLPLSLLTATACVDGYGPQEQQPASADPAPGGVVVAGAGLRPFAITADGYVVYGSADQALAAVPLGGGQPVVIDAAAGDPIVVAREGGRAVFEWMDRDGSLTLTAWTSAGGAHVLSPTANPRGFALSADESTLTYLEGLPSSQTLVVSGIDGSKLTTLSLGCSTAGFRPNGDVVAVPCGGGAVSLFSAATGWSRTELLPATAGATFASIDPTGAWLFVTTANGKELVEIATARATPLDPSVQAGVFDATGSAFYYGSQHALVRMALGTTTPTTLTPSGCDSVTRLSADGALALCSVGSSGYAVASTVQPGEATPLSTKLDGGLAQVVEPTFTPDPTFVLGTMRGDGTQEDLAIPTTGASPVALTSTGLSFFAALTGTEVVVAEANGDIRVVDAAGAAAPRVIAEGADPTGGAVLAPDRAHVAYVTAGAAPHLAIVSTK